MTSQLDVTDFELCRAKIYQIVEWSLENRGKLLAEQKITKKEYVDIGEQCEIPLRRKAKDLTIKISGNIFKDMTIHQGRIDPVTTKLKQVIANIQNFNKSIAFFTEVINFFGTVLTTGSRGIAGIPSLLDNFENILKKYP